MKALRIDRTESGAYTLAGQDVLVRGETVAPRIEGRPDGILVFEDGRERAARCGDMAGTVRSQVAQSEHYRFEREFFRSQDGAVCAIRVRLENTGDAPFALLSLKPLVVSGNDSLRVAGATYGDWRIFRLGRQKNDVSGCYTPGRQDRDAKDAAFRSGEIPAGLGVSEDDESKFTNAADPIYADPCVYIRNRHSEGEEGLFIGVLGQDEHLNELAIVGNDRDDELAGLSVTFEYDGVTVDPGDVRTSHWLMFWRGQSLESSMERYADLLAAQYECPPPAARAPSIYCSWYFYGESLTQDDVDENLRALSRHPVPVDAFLLDDGWSDSFGSWQPGFRFPDGLAAVAEKIKRAGMEPGIWTCPFVVMKRSPVVKEHPELVARDKDGNPFPFGYQGEACYALDPTSPYAETYFREVYGRLRSWGFTYYKFDFLRSIILMPAIRFHDRTMTRAQAYRLGMRLVREAIGEENYILGCGGLFEGSIGLVDGMRIGSDTTGRWLPDTYLKTMKQNFTRTYTNRFWHTDPDAAMLRRREVPYTRAATSAQSRISLGTLNDEEAFSIAVNQYLGGGMVCISERFAELDDDRRALLRHVLPVLAACPHVVDPWHEGCPTTFLTEVTPRCPSLKRWFTLAVGNWENETVTRTISLSDVGLPAPDGRWALFEFRTQSYLGVKKAKDTIELEIPAHGVRVVRITEWDGVSHVVLGTDAHITGGGVELGDVSVTDAGIEGIVDTPWSYPVRVTVGVPAADGLRPRTVTLRSGERFSIEAEAAVR